MARGATLPPDSWKTYSAVTDPTQGIRKLRTGVVKDHAAVFFPKIKLRENGVVKSVGPAGAIAGLMARTDATRGVWKAPAGTEASLVGVDGLEVLLTDMENGVLNKEGVNCLRAFPGGTVNWGGRTLDGAYDFASEWKYIPIRRLALFIEESLYRGTQWVVFEPNDEPLWAQIRLNLLIPLTLSSGAGTLSGNELYFTIEQLIENALGETRIITSGSFDLTTGLGTSTVENCFGPTLMCAGVDPLIGTPDATSEYTASHLNASDLDCITWDVIFTLRVPGFGEADSNSVFTSVLGSNCTDSDQDGYSVEGGCCGTVDCDDSDPDVYPGATEKCDDGKDNNCDGSINEGCECLVERLFAPNDARLKTIRRFRDEILYSNSLGVDAINLYYKKTDALINLVEDSPAIHILFKKLIETLVPVLEIMLRNPE